MTPLALIAAIFAAAAASVPTPPTPAPARTGAVLRVADLTTTKIQALDRSRTIVLLPGGILEEHGPYLPAWTDGILSERLTDELARGIAAALPDRTVLVFPQIPLGASGSNELGGQFVFPGTFAIRPSTLRAVFMDLAAAIGDLGFRSILVVHVHGAPLHNRALDEAADFFHDAYGGRMVHLWGLVPVLSGWGKALGEADEASRKEDGVSLHAGMDETSLLLHLAPDRVDPAWREARAIAGASLEESFAAAHRPDWPGYLGSPRRGSARLGAAIWTSFKDAALENALKILTGADPATLPRYADMLEKNPLYREWMTAAAAKDRALETREQDWIRAHVREGSF
jgi:creatinine amidohydrolase/Fe(II)-dependent formamide hydrolase-like protein